MDRSITIQRLGAFAVVASLFFDSGCRSASVGSRPSSGGSLPFFRSFERSEPNYDESAEPPEYPSFPSYSPTPVAPPGVLPVPGYSEPGHSNPELPPSPTTQKSLRRFIPSSLKRPVARRPQTDLHQTGSISSNETVLGTAESISSTAPELRNEPVAQTTQSRLPKLSTVPSGPVLIPPQAENDTQVSTRFGETHRATSNEFPATTPIKTRHGVIQQWPYANGASRSTSTESSEGRARQNASVRNTGTHPIADDSIPVLLPPNP